MYPNWFIDQLGVICYKLIIEFKGMKLILFFTRYINIMMLSSNSNNH